MTERFDLTSLSMASIVRLASSTAARVRVRSPRRRLSFFPTLTLSMTAVLPVAIAVIVAGSMPPSSESSSSTVRPTSMASSIIDSTNAALFVTTCQRKVSNEPVVR